MEQLEKKAAAKQFADQIRQLAENGHIDTMSLYLYDGSCDGLFRLAEKIGLRELKVTSVFGVSRQAR